MNNTTTNTMTKEQYDAQCAQDITEVNVQYTEANAKYRDKYNEQYEQDVIDAEWVEV